MSLSRRGSSLAELLIALSLTGMLATLTAKVLAVTTLTLRERSEWMAAEHGLRVASSAVRAALESLGTDSASGSDLLSNATAGFSARATRAAGVACAVSPGLLVARAGASWWSAVRLPVEGRDSILAGDLEEPVWRAYALRAPPGAALCPDGTSAIELPISGDSLALGAVASGSPLLVFENVELRLYNSAPEHWLGVRLLATAQPIQPLAGPFAALGFGLSYQSRDGMPAADPALVAGVSFRLTALTERAGGVGLIRGPAARPDSMDGFVALVNRR
jgi:hypothetical protein